MPEVKWTDEQLQAIKTKNCNLLVSAGAGSGKTAVLVARIIDTIINYNVDIDKLLIVTFTNAAASEMRERIAESLYNELNNKPEIQRQIMLLNKSSITTIHSFCLEVIREYFYKLDLDPNFRVGDETEQVLLKSETLDELFEEEFEEDNENFAKLINFYSEKNGDNQLKNLILKVYEFIQSTPFPKEWLNDKCNMYKLIENNDFGKTIWGSILLSYAKQEIDGNIADLKSLEEELLNYEDVENYIFTIKDDILNLEALNKCDTWDSYYNAISEFEFLKLKQARKASEDISELVKILEKKLKRILKNT
jgi:ATP-dependent helicase/nuclease subunit A